MTSYHVTKLSQGTSDMIWDQQIRPACRWEEWERVSNLFVSRLNYYFLVVISVIIAVFSIGNYR